MTTPTHTRVESERPEFAALRLDVDPDEVRETIETSLYGLHVTETDDGLLFRTTEGMLVAVVRGDGDGRSVFEYRDEPSSIRATRKARRLAALLGAELR